MFERKGMLARLREGLAKTRQGLADKVHALVTGRKAIDEDLYEELEAALIQADVGVQTTQRLLDGLRARVRERRVQEPQALYGLLKEEIAETLGAGQRVAAGEDTEPGDGALRLSAGRLNVIMIVGVNGVGKTTTIAKLAHRLKTDGWKVLLAAGDTFRAAAIEQLEVWGRRAGVEVIRGQAGSDPAAVVFDAIQAARSRRSDVLIVDTAGRLHTKVNLMEELKKIRRIIAREIEGAPQEVLLVLDATTGQNAIQQAKLFGEAVDVSGIILTKLDGTARGGIVVAIREGLGLPVKFIGIGEGLEDLKPFAPAEFVEALFG